MGFIDYAWAVSIQKDNTKVKILQNSALTQPILEGDDFGFTITLPTVKILEGGNISFLGHKFPATNAGKSKMGRLFRATVMHLTTHTMAPFPKEKIVIKKSDSFVESFAKSLINDTYNNAYIQAWYPDRFFDFAYANAVAYQKIKSSERIFTVSTKLMVALLTKLNVGLIKSSPGIEEEKTVDLLYNNLKAVSYTHLTLPTNREV